MIYLQRIVQNVVSSVLWMLSLWAANGCGFKIFPDSMLFSFVCCYC